MKIEKLLGMWVQKDDEPHEKIADALSQWIGLAIFSALMIAFGLAINWVIQYFQGRG